jgi:hypothetical protein
MTEQILSAGVYSYENDQSFYSQGNTTTGLALVGPTEKGAAFVPTDITSYSQFQAVFGSDTKASYVPQTAYSYLQAGSTVKVTRILGNGGFQYNSAKKLAALVSGSTILAVFYPTLNDAANTVNLNSASIAGTYATFSFSFGTSSYFTSTGFSASLNPTANTYVTKVIGNDQNFQTGSVFPYLSFQNVLSAGQLTGAVASVFTTTNCTFTSSNSNGYDHASTPWILSDGGVRLFKIHHKSDGFKTNQDVKISISNIIKGVDANTYSTFNVLVRKWDDTDKNVSVIEQFINVSLNPDAANYIVKVIGDTYFAYDTTQQRVIGHGDYANNSNYIRVEVTNGVAGGSIHPQVVPNGYEAVYETIAGFSGSFLPAASVTSSNSSSYIYSGFDYSNSDNFNYLNPVPAEAVVGLNTAFTKPVSDNKFTLPMQGGTDGMNYTTIKKMGAAIANDGTNVFGFDLSTATSGGTLAYGKALSILNSEEYQFDLLALPGVIEQYHPQVTALAQATVEYRTDSVYLRDLTGVDTTIITAVNLAGTLDTSYSAVYYPWVKVKDLATTKDILVPPSVVVPQAYAYNDKVAAEWFAPAGLNRGGIGGAIDTRIRLSKADRDALYQARINPIAKFPNSGVVIWGQKTLQVKDTALNRINVRRLLINLRTFVSNTAKNYVFENNTDATRNKLVGDIVPYMENVQLKQGLYAFRVEIDDVLNTNDVIDRNQLIGKIYISPAKGIEFILLEFNIQPTGATFQ